MGKSAIKATARRGVFGIPAKARIAQYTMGVEATTHPPMMIITICTVNGTKDQKFWPPWRASFAGLW
ncbi:MAG TPA: hypothetical protein VGZ91_00110 [Candidatus Sulfotelmatobacter sp.]|jgi:hypothetical protein|nr:hypothetical protein [Candidatus Sulfotelmatobacter sp.]